MSLFTEYRDAAEKRIAELEEQLQSAQAEAERELEVAQAYEVELAGLREQLEKAVVKIHLVEGRANRAEEQLESVQSENRLLREEIRIREESQIPMVPRAFQEQLGAARKALREIENIAAEADMHPDVYEAITDRTRIVSIPAKEPSA